MTEATPVVAAPLTPTGLLGRLRAAAVSVWVAVTGAAPHVLHHVGPLAGSALVAGAGGRLIFGVLGFVATIPTLRRLRRRTGNWRAPALALAAFAAIFTVSTLVIGPAIAGDGEASTPAPVVDEHHGDA